MNVKYRNCPICDSSDSASLFPVNKILLRKCTKCTMVYADLAIDDAETANSYSSEKLISYIKSEPRSTIVHYDQIIRTILRLSHVQRPKILDFGCGAGMFVRRCLKAGLDAQGIDKSPYVEEARKAFRLPLHSCDLLEGPFSKGQFDVIFSHATFEHLYDPVTIGHSLTNMLKPGGHLIFTAIPNFNTVSIRVFKNFFANTPPGHINFFESATLFDFFSRLGMQEIKVNTYGVDV